MDSPKKTGAIDRAGSRAWSSDFVADTVYLPRGALDTGRAMSYLGRMRKTLLHRVAMLMLLAAVMVGWSAQAFSFATTGSCVAGMDMGASAPMDSSDNGDDAASMPCKGITVRCMNSMGCVVFVGLPQATCAVEQIDRYGDPELALADDLVGLSPEPELSPPIQAA